MTKAPFGPLLRACAVGLFAILITADVLAEEHDLGERLYSHGVTAAGVPVTAVTQGDIEVTGDWLRCVNCHRKSGMGSSEGGRYVPPITARHLFQERRASKALRNERFKELFQEAQPDSYWVDLRMPRVRPAYDEETLARAIRTGLDPSGRVLDPLMPRYDLSDQDMANLTAYLAGLSRDNDPGVDAGVLRLATVVSEGVEPAKREAVLDTINGFVRWINTGAKGRRSRASFSPYYRSDFETTFLTWDLEVWTLRGPPSAWHGQLEELYREKPVFAVVSGLVDGPWRSIADFCDAEALPCLFPNTVMPRTSAAEGRYTLYFTRGLELEGEALAVHLAGRDPALRRVLQIIKDDERGRRPAAAFRRKLAQLQPGLPLDDVIVSGTEALADAIAKATLGDAEVLVIWPGSDQAAAVATLDRQGPSAATVFLPSDSLKAAKAGLDRSNQDRVRLLYPYEVTPERHPRSFRVRAWMGSRGLAVSDWRLQSQTYYALTVLQSAFEQMLTDFYRDYLIEIIEQVAEDHLNPGTYPHLALGPGQRFASKGAYVIALDRDLRPGFRAVSDWIIP